MNNSKTGGGCFPFPSFPSRTSTFRCPICTKRIVSSGGGGGGKSSTLPRNLIPFNGSYYHKECFVCDWCDNHATSMWLNETDGRRMLGCPLHCAAQITAPSDSTFPQGHWSDLPPMSTLHRMTDIQLLRQMSVTEHPSSEEAESGLWWKGSINVLPVCSGCGYDISDLESRSVLSSATASGAYNSGAETHTWHTGCQWLWKQFECKLIDFQRSSTPSSTLSRANKEEQYSTIPRHIGRHSFRSSSPAETKIAGLCLSLNNLDGIMFKLIRQMIAKLQTEQYEQSKKAAEMLFDVLTGLLRFLEDLGLGHRKESQEALILLLDHMKNLHSYISIEDLEDSAPISLISSMVSFPELSIAKTPLRSLLVEYVSWSLGHLYTGEFDHSTEAMMKVGALSGSAGGNSVVRRLSFVTNFRLSVLSRMKEAPLPPTRHSMQLPTPSTTPAPSVTSVDVEIEIIGDEDDKEEEEEETLYQMMNREENRLPDLDEKCGSATLPRPSISTLKPSPPPSPSLLPDPLLDVPESSLRLLAHGPLPSVMSMVDRDFKEDARQLKAPPPLPVFPLPLPDVIMPASGPSSSSSSRLPLPPTPSSRDDKLQLPGTDLVQELASLMDSAFSL